MSDDDLRLISAYGRCVICGAPRHTKKYLVGDVTHTALVCTNDEQHGPDVPKESDDDHA